MNLSPALQKRSVSPQGRRAGSGRWLLLVATVVTAPVLTLTAGGCVGSDSESTGARTAVEARLDVVEPIVGCSLDCQPVKGPREMAGTSDLVVRGKIGEPRAGLVRYRHGGTKGRVETDIIPIEVDSLLWGGFGRDTGTSIPHFKPPLVELETGCAFPPPGRAAQLASLAGRQVVAYLIRGTGRGPGEFRDGTFHYAEGPPQPPVRETGPEGLLIEFASGKVVRNLDLNHRFPGADLTDFYPDRRRFPPKTGP